jgi:long-chain acyl-CoA synthetase
MPASELLLPQLLARTLARVPERVAFLSESRRVTYADLGRDVRAIAAGLQRRGIQRGDRVALMMPNSVEFAVALFALWEIGAVATPTCTIYTRTEATAQWSDADVALILADPKCADVACAAARDCPHAPAVVLVNGAVAGADNVSWSAWLATGDQPTAVELSPRDLACLQYTGGTTGVAKGAMLTHANIVANVFQSAACVALGRAEHDVLVGALPFFHIFALTCVLAGGVAHGATVIVFSRFEARNVLETFRRHRPTIFHGVPTMFIGFLNTPEARPEDFDSIRVCMSGGAALPVEVMRNFQARFLRHGQISEGYGLSETSPVTHANPPDGPVVAGSIGKPAPETEVRVVDVKTGTCELPTGDAGEIVIRGPQVMMGYWRAPQETARVLRDGWLHTGDIGYRDDAGYFYLVDRKKDLVIAGGFNVYPREVEEALFRHPAIAEAVVIGVPDPYRGETVKAFVVRRPDMALDAEAVIAHCRQHLAAYKVPRVVEFRSALPKSGVGKYLRRELRAEEITRSQDAQNDMPKRAATGL